MNVFRDRKFRAAAFGYFGHMWELYAFWTFIPLMLGTYVSKHSLYDLNISQLSFTIIAIGGFACVLGGYFSQAIGVKRTATTALLLSCLCCLISPLLFATDSQYLFIGFLLFWGMVVIADSPLFSTLVAQRAPADIKGTALTIVNSIGFAVTIISIQLISILRSQFDSSSIYMILAIGPLLGLWALSRSSDEKSGT
jgi:MFS family permease